MSTLKLSSGIPLPSYSMSLPVSGINAKFRPFVVKEEKVLLIALQSKSPEQITDAMHDIIMSCTDGKVNSKKICAADSEYAFLQIRSKSIGEEAKPKVICGNCNSSNTLKVRLDQFTLKTDHVPKEFSVKIYDNIVLNMRYPTIHDLETKTNTVMAVFDIAKHCIESVVLDDQIHMQEDIDPKELSDFIDNMIPTEFEKIMAFFEHTPKLNYELAYNCPTCKERVKVKFKSITDFF